MVIPLHLLVILILYSWYNLIPKSVQSADGDKGSTFFLGKILVAKKNGRVYLEPVELVSGSVKMEMDIPQ